VIKVLQERLAREEGRTVWPGIKDDLLTIGKRCTHHRISALAPLTISSVMTRMGCRADGQMVTDTSALLAVLFNEPGAQASASAIEADSMRLVSAVSALEAAIVVEARKGPAGGRELDLLFHRAQADIVAFGRGSRGNRARCLTTKDATGRRDGEI
jgi:hypothetical protein